MNDNTGDDNVIDFGVAAQSVRRAKPGAKLTAEDRKAVLNDLRPGESAASRLREASEWAPILGSTYSKSRLSKARILSFTSRRAEKKMKTPA